LASKPRMADFARVLAAVDIVMGTSGLKHYISKQRTAALDSLSSDPFLLALAEMRTTFTGTSAELLTALQPERPPKDWPTNARAVTTVLKRNAPALRKAGWTVTEDGGRNQSNSLRWTLKPPEIARNSPSRDSCPSSDDELTSVASHENVSSQDDLCPQCDGEGCDWCSLGDAEVVRV